MAAHKKKTGGVKRFANAEQYWEDESVIYNQCDIFIQATFEKTVNASNAEKINYKIIAEGANNHHGSERKTSCQRCYLFTRYFAYAGGVTASYLEWLKNLKHSNPGRMTRRWQEQGKHRILEVIKMRPGLNINIKDSKLAKTMLEDHRIHTALKPSITLWLYLQNKRLILDQLLTLALSASQTSILKWLELKHDRVFTNIIHQNILITIQQDLLLYLAMVFWYL
ncbi:unnamed protein product [Paramecium sonneborni]|uniref:Glutamate/phenylalanine/leucine/valine/L-tryptophan dehydrogenase C-terminal domain-containing protein n=1 Tax=Paramecium sonneborni TaxID=65129 RepID=A0A8S1MQP7_9CILI|nr:unnamed protein product [Paramecium sonneborni]